MAWVRLGLGLVLMLGSTALLAALLTDPKAPRPAVPPVVFMLAGGVIGAVLFLDSLREVLR